MSPLERMFDKPTVVLAVAVVVAAVCVSGAGFLQTPTYEVTAYTLVAHKQGDQPGEEIQPLPPPGQLEQIIPVMMHAIDSRPVAEETIQRLELEMPPAELLDKLTVEQIKDTRYTSYIVLTYEDTDPARAQLIANTVGKVSSELVSERGARSPGSNLTASVYEEAIVPESPVSPDPLRNGLLTLVIGLIDRKSVV